MALFKKKEEKKKKTAAPASNAVVSAVPTAGMRHTLSAIRKPHVTEKTLRLGEQNKYVFISPAHVSKNEAAKQIEKLYNVKCVSVHSMQGSVKPKYWRGKSGTTGTFKKIIVTLQKGQKIELTGQA